MSQTNLVIIINGAASVSIAFLPGPVPNAPVAPGTVMGTFVISPSPWSGAVALSGADASSFVLNEVGGVPTLAVGAQALTARTYNLTATATP